MQDRQLVHDVPVEVIGRRQWADYEEPSFKDFHVTLQLPTLKSVRNIVERMKNMSHYLIVAANKDGRLTLKIETNLVKLSAHFPNLSVQSIAGMDVRNFEGGKMIKGVFLEGLLNNPGEQDDEEEGVTEFVCCQIDIKKFLMFLTGLQITNHKTICSIVNGKMVKLHFEQPGVVTLQCFLTEIEA